VKTEVVLVISASDSSGGSGLQADLRTIAAYGLHAVTVVTAITAQTAATVRTVEPVSPSLVRDQLAAALDAFSPLAVKIGLLPTLDVVDALGSLRARLPDVPVVVDPVVAASDGTHLQETGVVEGLLEHVLPSATLVTPNAIEVGILLGEPAPTCLVEQMASACRLAKQIGSGVLVKGGHVAGSEVADVLVAGGEVTVLEAARIEPQWPIRGTGCILSSAIVCGLATGRDLEESVVDAREHLRRRMAGAKRLGNEPAAIA
jgi:hydroxymethylpyrimidine/phosphomethylpyrimidine kinase